MTQVWIINADLGENHSLELVNEGFNGAHGSVADLMVMIEEGNAESITITRGEYEPQESTSGD